MKTHRSIIKSIIGFILLWCSSSTLSAAVDFTAQELIDATSIDIQYSGMVLNRRTGNFEIDATLINISPSPISGPFYFALEEISSSNVNILNHEDVSTQGTPYFVLNTTIFNPNDSLSLKLEFSNPSRERFTFEEKIYGPAVADVVSPDISVDNPVNGETVNTAIPTINILFSDSGSGVDINTFQLVVNGVDVTSSATVSATGATYTPSNPLGAGTVTVSALIIDNAGNTGSIASTFVVSVFRAIADCAPTSGPAPLDVRFRSRGEFTGGSIIRFRWDFDGNGTFDSNDTVARDYDRTFNTIGSHQAMLQVTNNFGDTATDSCTINVRGKSAVATASATPTNGPTPLAVIFTGSGSKEDGVIVRHEWDLDGDGVYEINIDTFDSTIPMPNSITFNINHATCSSGEFNFYLNNVLLGTSNGSTGCICNSFEPAFTFSDSALIANNWLSAGGNVLKITAPSTLFVAYIKSTLTNSSDSADLCVFDENNDNCTTRSLCSGNGFSQGGIFSSLAESQGLNTSTVNHTYTEAGSFDARFRVTDSDGETAIASVSTTAVRVGPPGSPSVSTSASPISGNGPLTVNFDGSATDDGSIVSWQWDFEGDGTYDYSSTTSPTTTHIYNDAGVYVAALKATDDDGLSNTALVEIKVAATASLSRPTDTFDPDIGSQASVNTTLSAGSQVKVQLKDKNGFVVRTLFDGFRSGGTYTDQWNGRDNAGFMLPEGPYYAVLEYLSAGEVRTVDLTNSTGGARYNPSRSRIPGTFSPFAGNPLTINFTLNRASEVTAFIGRFRVNTRLITFLERVPLGKGTHRLVWNGENADGQLMHPPPGDRFLFGIWGYTLPDNAIYLQNGAHVSNVAVSPPIFDPAGHVDDQGTPSRSVTTFDLSKTANVELTVSDAETGQTVARRFANGLSAGAASVEWDGKDDNGVFVAPGRYRLGVAAFDSNGYRSMRVYALQRIYY